MNLSIDLALKHKLRRPLREAIAQHHGTSLVYYFYHRAKQRLTGARGARAVGEGEYRYPGPKPIRKEIALLSIADSCEAAARTIEKPTPQKIADLVDELVVNRIRDHQFDEADLTFAELAVAKEAIGRTLGTMLHGRIKYPKEYDDGDPIGEAAPEATPPGPKAPAESYPDGVTVDAPQANL